MLWIIATRGESEILADPPMNRLPELLSEPGTHIWVNLTPPIDEADYRVMLDVFKFHPLAVEDCFEERAHPKVDDYGDYLYLITHGLSAQSTSEQAEPVETDAFLGARYIVTHHHTPSRSIATTREAVLRSGLPLRRGPAGVLHSILDRQVDGLEPVFDGMEQRIEQVEDAVFDRPEPSQVEAILTMRSNILQLRRWMSKQREILYRLGRGEFQLVATTDAFLFRDVYDHLVRINDLIESFREMLSSTLDAYVSLTSNRLSEVMRFLTVFTVVLMPLTVITGIYGMNFDNMPELRWPWGYFAVLGVMATVAGSILIYFRYRGWLGRPPPLPEPSQPEPRRADAGRSP